MRLVRVYHWCLCRNKGEKDEAEQESSWTLAVERSNQMQCILLSSLPSSSS